MGKILAFPGFLAHFSSLPAQFFQEFGLRWLAFGQNTGIFTVFYPIFLLASSVLSGLQASLARIWTKHWHFHGFLPNFLPCQLSSFRNSGFIGSNWEKSWRFRSFLPIFPPCQLSSSRNSGSVGSRLGKTLAFPQFFTQSKDSYSSFIISCTNFAQCSAAFFSKVG